MLINFCIQMRIKWRHLYSRKKVYELENTFELSQFDEYREDNSHCSLKEGHSFERLSDHEYLRSIGATAISDEDGNVCDFYFRVYNKIIKDIKVPFKMVGGERAGSGVPNIFNVWADEGWEEPVIEERFFFLWSLQYIKQPYLFHPMHEVYSSVRHWPSKTLLWF